jgi:GT2 family glycosyltransferase
VRDERTTKLSSKLRATSPEPAESGNSELSTRIALRASVIVCAYTEDRMARIDLALKSLGRQTMLPCQVVLVVDHNPILGEHLAAAHPDVEVIPNKFSRGLSGARNTGVQHSIGDIVVFLDDDACPEPDWLQALLIPYADESVLGVGGLVLADWDLAARPTWLPEEFLWVVGCSYRGLPESTAEVRNPIGASMSFRRHVFDRAGLFDSSVGRNMGVSRPLGCEETEFSIRLRSLCPGGRIMYEPRSVVYHQVTRSRATWRYFLSRCYSEGVSKARVARLQGTSAALSSEGSYVTQTISRAIRRELGLLLRPGRSDALGRLAALVAGVLWTAAGYIIGAFTAERPTLRRNVREE